VPSPAEPSAADLAACRAVIRTCSRSFDAASRLLPPDVRAAAVATYAFCRAADDDVDEAGSLADATRRHQARRERLARIYAGQPADAPADRAFAWVVQRAGIPRREPEALLDGMADDLGPRRVADLDELLLYCWRAAGVVGAMMSRIMGRGDAVALRHAVDLGIAMQLSNVARDVGEDAGRGRVYLPATWLTAAGSSPDEVLALGASPEPTARVEPPTVARASGASAATPGPAVRAVTHRLLALAERYYASGIDGIRLLPPSCRPAILSAALLYRAIGRGVRARDGDGVSARVRVGTAAKLGLVGVALGRCLVDPRLRGGGRCAAGSDAAALHAALARAGVPDVARVDDSPAHHAAETEPRPNALVRADGLR